MEAANWKRPTKGPVSGADSEAILRRIKAASIDHEPTFDSVGVNTGPGGEAGARGLAPIEIRTYEH
jgi:hypothetical protein